MNSEEYVFDTVKFEKMKAMERYNRFRKIKNILVVIEVVVALTLISWSSTYLPQALKVSGDFFFKIADYVFKPHVIFLIGNSIIVALVVLCRETDAGNNQHSGDVLDEYSQFSHQKEVVAVHEEIKKSPETMEMISAGVPDVQDKQIVYVVPSPPLVEDKVIQTEVQEQIKVEDEEEEEKSSAVATAVKVATKQIQKFQRTQSARLKREITVLPRLELRRSETYRRSKTTSVDSVDNLSNDEFNLTVAAYIKKHQEFLWQQKLAEKAEF